MRFSRTKAQFFHTDDVAPQRLPMQPLRHSYDARFGEHIMGTTRCPMRTTPKLISVLAVNLDPGGGVEVQTRTERMCRATSQTTAIRGVQSPAIGGGDGDRLPVLRRSCHPEEIRQNQAAERRQPVEVTGDDGLVHSTSIGTAVVGTKNRSGPPPTISYARCGPGSDS